MRSLFPKILAWFLFATLLTAFSALFLNLIDGEPFPPDRAVAAVLRGAVESANQRLRAGEMTQLEQDLQQFRADAGLALRIVDRTGADVLTGEDLSDWIVGARTPDRPVKFSLGPPRLVVASADGGLRGVVDLRQRFRLLRPVNLAVLLMAVALCWVLARHISRPVVNLQRAVDGFRGGAVDLGPAADRRDEIGDLGRAFESMANRIAALLDGQRRILLDISHESRSPLARLTIAADLLKSNPSDGQSLRQIEVETQRINELVSEILMTARNTVEMSERPRTRASIPGLLMEIKQATRLEAEARDCSIDVEGPSEAVVLAAPELLRRAVENVLRNAIQHAPPGSEVKMRLRSDSGQAELTIRDHGPGVPDEALPHLFNPFYRADGARSRSDGGVGLGLAIARQAVESQGGAIAARNSAPGLEVTIRLPLAPSS